MGTIQQVFQHSFEAYREQHRLPVHLIKAGQALMNCRTATLGGHVQRCPDGHVQRVWYNSCKHRSCPSCHAIQGERWLQGERDRLLAYRHHHVIFTFPHQLIPLWQWNSDAFTPVLFEAVRATLLELTANERWLGAQPGFLLTLHSWGRSLALHPHIHCLITDGGLDAQGQWRTPKRSCFLPAQVVMQRFRGKLLAALGEALAAGQWTVPPGESLTRVQNVLNKLGRRKWNVHFRTRYDHGQGVATYWARYVRGGPLKNSQLRQVTATHVCYRFYAHQDNPDGRKYTPTEWTLTHEAFIQRYLPHIPVPGRQLVRHYGLYANGQRARLGQARTRHGQPPLKPTAVLDWQTYYERWRGPAAATTCPVCGQRLVTGERWGPRHHDPPNAQESHA